MLKILRGLQNWVIKTEKRVLRAKRQPKTLGLWSDRKKSGTYLYTLNISIFWGHSHIKVTGYTSNQRAISDILLLKKGTYWATDSKKGSLVVKLHKIREI